MSIFSFKLLDDKFVVNNMVVSNVPVIFNQSYFQFINLTFVTLYFKFQILAFSQIIFWQFFKFSEILNFKLLFFIFLILMFKFLNKLLYNPFITGLLKHDCINFRSVLDFKIVNEFFEICLSYSDFIFLGLLFFFIAHFQIIEYVAFFHLTNDNGLI